LIVAVIELSKNKRRPAAPLEQAKARIAVESTLEAALNQNRSGGNQFAKIHPFRQAIEATRESGRPKLRLRPMLQAT
jgi:hypothetical protein